MRRSIAVGAFGAALACSGAAPAAVFKCNIGGTVTYQQHPCMPGGAETRMDGGDKLMAWEGCYATRPRRWRGTSAARAFIEVRRSPEGAVLIINDQKQPFPLRAVNTQELQWFENAMPAAASEGVGVRWSPAEQEVAERRKIPPFGLYRTKDERGQPMLVALIPVITGEVEKVQCMR
jgi:hypothetical protein